MHELAARVVRLYGPRDLRFDEIGVDPRTVGPHEICAVTEHSAVSVGTEKAAYIGLPALRAGPAYPRLVGYCNAARVVSTGAKVSGVLPGDRILTHQSHRSAFVCDAADLLAIIPPGIDSKVASTAYIAHIALNALQRAALREGEAVVVQGLGPIGLATIALARALGAAQVVAIGNARGRMQRALGFGAAAALDAGDADLPEKFQAVAGGGVHVVVNTVNAWSAWKTSLALVRPFGRIAVLGFPGRGEPPPDFNPLASDPFYVKQPSILSVGLAAGEGLWGEGDIPDRRRKNMAYILDLALSGKLPLQGLITHERSWHELKSIYESAAAGDKEMIVPVLSWNVGA